MSKAYLAMLTAADDWIRAIFSDGILSPGQAAAWKRLVHAREAAIALADNHRQQRRDENPMKEDEAMIDRQQSEPEIAADGSRSRRMDLLCPACGHKLGTTMAHPEPLTRNHRSVALSVILDSVPTPPPSGESPVSPGEQ